MSANAAVLRSPTPPVDREVTPEELLTNPQWGRCELLHGKVIPMSPAGHKHGEVVSRLNSLIWGFVSARGLGRVYAAETGFVFPDGKTVRAPDVMFLSNQRLPRDLPEEGFLPVSPDLAIEVVSPFDSFRDVMDKAESYLAAGVRLVWVVDIGGKRAYVLRPDRDMQRLSLHEDLEGGDILPGFRARIQDLLQH